MTARRASVRRRLRRKRRHKDWRERASIIAALHLRTFDLQRDLRAQGMVVAAAHVDAARDTIWRKLVKIVFDRSKGMEESKP